MRSPLLAERGAMTEKLGYIILNSFDDLCLSLRTIHASPYLELQIYPREAATGANKAPAQEPILFPAQLLPLLLRVLTQAQDALLKRGLIHLPEADTGEATAMEHGSAITMRLDGRPGRSDARRHARMHVGLRVDCLLLDTEQGQPSKPITGELKDISLGGAQAWFSERLPRFKQVEVTMTIQGKTYRGRAEIVGAEVEGKRDPKTGRCRHHLRWIVMDGAARAALSRIVPSNIF